MCFVAIANLACFDRFIIIRNRQQTIMLHRLITAVIDIGTVADSYRFPMFVVSRNGVLVSIF